MKTLFNYFLLSLFFIVYFGSCKKTENDTTDKIQGTWIYSKGVGLNFEEITGALPLNSQEKRIHSFCFDGEGKGKLTITITNEQYSFPVHKSFDYRIESDKIYIFYDLQFQVHFINVWRAKGEEIQLPENGCMTLFFNRNNNHLTLTPCDKISKDAFNLFFYGGCGRTDSFEFERKK